MIHNYCIIYYLYGVVVSVMKNIQKIYNTIKIHEKILMDVGYPLLFYLQKCLNDDKNDHQLFTEIVIFI